MEEKKKGLFDVISENRQKEEDMLAKMSKEEQEEYMKEKSKRGLDIAKKLGLKVGD